MDLFKKFSLKTAMPNNRQKHVCTNQHITTSDFFQLTPVYSKELVPNTDFKLDCTAFGRLEALAVPTFGRCQLKLSAFFVPYCYVWRPWHNFIQGTPYYGTDSSKGNSPSRVPLVKESTLSGMFWLDAEDDGVNRFARYAGPGETPDFVRVILDAEDVIAGEDPLILLPYGRMFLKVLVSLGYNISFTVSEDPDKETYYNALPLLCWLRCWYDYFQPSQYVGWSEQFGKVSQLLSLDSANIDSQVDAFFANISTMHLLHFILSTNYNDDYFTSAWDSPVAPASSAEIDRVEIPDISTHGESKVTMENHGTSDATPFIQNKDEYGSVYNISQYLTNTLKKLTDYVTRNRLAGSRVQDRYKARFGMDLSHADTRTAYYLGSKSIDLQVGDVFSTADTEGATLGDFAGRGYLADNGDFSVDTKDEYGLFLVFATIIPETGYCQGVDRSVLQKTRFDFWSPEFDGLGTQAISKAELFMPRYQQSGSSYVGPEYPSKSYIDGIFGFTPRYSHMKVKQSQLTGDFLLPTKNLGKDSWHLYRMFDVETLPSDVVHSVQFVQGLEQSYDEEHGATDVGSQFDRIFSNTSNSADHFNLFYSFRFSMYTPMKSLFDVYDFDEEEGRKILADLNGKQLN